MIGCYECGYNEIGEFQTHCLKPGEYYKLCVGAYFCTHRIEDTRYNHCNP